MTGYLIMFYIYLLICYVNKDILPKLKETVDLMLHPKNSTITGADFYLRFSDFD